METVRKIAARDNISLTRRTLQTRSTNKTSVNIKSTLHFFFRVHSFTEKLSVHR